jgi:hypothetical protein
MATGVKIKSNSISLFVVSNNKKQINKESLKNLVPGAIKNKNKEISRAARARIKKAIQKLIDVKTVNDKILKKKKSIYINMITLTLSAKQVHSDVQIKKCLNSFFSYMRKYCNFKYYVWRAEKQKNGNIHFHIVTPQFIEYKKILKIWNNSIELLGYVSEYNKKMNSLSMKEYINLRKEQDKKHRKKVDVRSYIKAYKEGKKSGFVCNSVDVRSIYLAKGTFNYLLKYLAKEQKQEEEQEQEGKRIVEGRVYSISRELDNLEEALVLEYDEMQSIYCKIIEELGGEEGRGVLKDYSAYIKISLKELLTVFERYAFEFLRVASNNIAKIAESEEIRKKIEQLT